jgi:hypothetical protein
VKIGDTLRHPLYGSRAVSMDRGSTHGLACHPVRETGSSHTAAKTGHRYISTGGGCYAGHKSVPIVHTHGLNCNRRLHKLAVSGKSAASNSGEGANATPGDAEAIAADPGQDDIGPR